MLEFLATYWIDLLIALGGLSAFVVYFKQKRDSVRSAATLIIAQIDYIEKNVLTLKENPHINNVEVYKSKIIIKENMWEQHKQLFVKKLSSSEYEKLQQFFDSAEQIERIRKDIIGTMATAWRDKSSTEHNMAAKIIETGTEEFLNEIVEFGRKYRPLDLVFTPDIAIESLITNLKNFYVVSGTTAYQKIQKISYNK